MRILGYLLLIFGLLTAGCGDDDEGMVPQSSETIRLSYARLGSQSIASGNTVPGVGNIVLGFSGPVTNRSQDLFAVTTGGQPVMESEAWNTAGQEVTISSDAEWVEGQTYTVMLLQPLEADGLNALGALSLLFTIERPKLRVNAIRSDTNLLGFSGNFLNQDISVNSPIDIVLSLPVSLPAGQLASVVGLNGPGNPVVTVTAPNDTVLRLTPNEALQDYATYTLRVNDRLGRLTDRAFTELTVPFFTGAAAERDFPSISDEALMTLTQHQTFRYFWDFAEPNSGMARERNTSGRLVTSGGSGFGLMAMIVGVERRFITLPEAIERWQRVVTFLEGADRFHGAWSHWINGETGRVIPFSERDDGGDLVETALLVQGLLTVRQYLLREAPAERALADRITELWRGVEWDWYTKGQDEALFWHWSPENEFAINLRIGGHNETQLTYILAAASPSHPIDPAVYRSGYARNGNMQNGRTFYGHELFLGKDLGGPLFFAHYSYLGLDPRNLEDRYANYQRQNVNHTLINRAYCIANPRRHFGYSAQSWGLTASDGPDGYSAHEPDNDRGVITPTAALSSMPFTPEESMTALRHFYYDLGDRLWGEYGFYDAFHPGRNWTANSYLAIDQGPIVVMLENHRTGLLWDLFMSAPEIRTGLDRLDFTY